MGKKHSKVILFSGGWDSTLCALKIPDADLLFISYGQSYLENELKTARTIAKELNKELFFADYPLGHDAKNRNFLFCTICLLQKYDEIILGTRNILPIFDKYKDSNWLYLKLFAMIHNVKITMPIVGYTKKMIIKEVRENINSIPYNCYLNETNENCNCVNCLELKRILK